MTDSPEVLKERVRHCLAHEVGPALDMDGTQIEVLDVSDGIEEQLRRHVPGIRAIEAVP